MYHSGLGGGGFALIRSSASSKEGGAHKYTVIDYRETAPASASEDMYRGNINGSIFGGLAAGVPGELRGLEYAHKRFGVLPWYDVVYPAARVAEDGFEVTVDTVRYMDFGVGAAGWNFLVEDPSWARDFAPDGMYGLVLDVGVCDFLGLVWLIRVCAGTLVKLGDIMYRKRYAK